MNLFSAVNTVQTGLFDTIACDFSSGRLMITEKSMLPAVFLDRDGVLIEYRKNYIRQWSDVVFYSSALNALAALRELSCRVFVVTNQSAVGRGLITIKDAVEINNWIVSVVEQGGGRVDAVYMCPHKPEDNCDCRKPKPGMILQAAKTFAIDLQHSLIVGDSLSDLEAGQAAGIRHRYLVRTGRGTQEEVSSDGERLKGIFVVDDLAQAISNHFERNISDRKVQLNRLSEN